MIAKGYAPANGTMLYYEMVGEGPALTLLHSGYTDLRLWDDQFEVFGKYFKVIRYDVRGFGRSAAPVEPFSHFEDLKELLKYLGIKKTHLLGVSMGGSIAIDFTLQYPDMVDCLILSGSSLNGYSPVYDEASRLRSKAGLSIAKRDKDFDKSVEFLLNDPMWKQHSDAAHKRLKEMIQNTSLGWALKDLTRPADPQAFFRLSEIQKLTLLIVGSEDAAPILEITNLLDANIAEAKKVIIDGTGHLPNLDKYEVFNEVVLSFLKI